MNPSEGRMGVAAGVRGRTGRALRWFIAVGLLLGFGWFFATRLDPAALVRALGGADYRLVLLCAVGHMVILHPLKAWRWSLMLAPMQRISPWTLYQYNLAGCAATNVLPARSGQAVRVVLVCRHGLPVTGAIAVVVLEEILNASVLALIALPLPF
ncbi:MAG: flippase-like domain-containing protein, partial [Deltaproteobacteria bacterium]